MPHNHLPMRVVFSLLLTLLMAGAQEKPNILLILADDLGFSDLGCYGGEIATPRLDALAMEGVRFSQFYNTARCWPTRAALLTGYYPQQIRRDTVPGVRSGGSGTRPSWAPLLPTLLKEAGYRSYHSGKWHLDGMPIAEGFDRSYYLKDQGRFFHPQVHHRDDKKLPPIEPGTDFYGTTVIADHALACLQEHARVHRDQPFFHYLAFTAPHFPLHALPEDIARYQNRYDKGWEVIRRERRARQHHHGLFPNTPLSPVERDLGPPYHFPTALQILGPSEVNRPLPWENLTDRQQVFQSTKMALHAAMIDRMDREIGRVVDQLKVMGAYDDTLIVFLSDNGASAEIMVRSDGHDPQAPPGSASSYLCLGPGWSTACNTPFRRHKTWVHEGGIATPFLLSWPAGLKKTHQVVDQVGHVIDLVPTILELTNITQEEGESVPPRPGQSLLPSLRGAKATPRSLWWLHEGNRAYRADQWKLVAAKGDPWELYDLSKDRSETNNLADAFPNKASELQQAWETRWRQFQQQASGD